jgi:hypothetical protein
MLLRREKHALTKPALPRDLLGISFTKFWTSAPC